MAFASAGEDRSSAFTIPGDVPLVSVVHGPEPLLVPADVAVDIQTLDRTSARRRPPWVAVSLSAAVHFLALVILGVVIMPRDRQGDVAIQLFALPDLYEQDRPQQAPPPPTVKVAAPEVGADLEPEGGSGLLAPPPDIALIPLPAGGKQGNENGRESGEGDQQGAGTGNGLGGEPKNTTAEFFGVEAVGDRFAFVIDASGSMHGVRYARAVKEIIYTLRRLGKDHKFYVVLFNKYDFPQFHPDRTKVLLPATEENIKHVEQWLRSFVPRENTQPIPALRRALQMEPDAIYFLSDGAFTPQVLPLLRQYNRKSRTVIHTIALENRDGEALLRQISREHKGTYLFVD